jgi:mannose-1-phosphate guanylyltransferase
MTAYRNPLQQHLWAIVLAGGNGRRLQYFLKSSFGMETPKQYCALVGSRSMLRHTIDRAMRLIAPERVLTIINSSHAQFAAQQLQDQHPRNIIHQPFGRETGPGILLPLLHVYQRDPLARVVIFPSDHFVLEEDKFMEYVSDATRLIELHPQTIVTLGIEPDRVSDGYGWIEPGEEFGWFQSTTMYRVRHFWEKPNGATLFSLFNKGCLWNTMVTVTRADTLLELYRYSMPEVFQPFRRIVAAIDTPREQEVVEEVFRKIPTVNFSRAILETCPQQIGVVKVQGVYWSDWGEEDRVRTDLQRFGYQPQPASVFQKTEHHAAGNPTQPVFQ